MTKLIVMTGVTSGLGLETVRHLAAHDSCTLIAGARTPESASTVQAVMGRERLTLLPLDLADLASVRAFAQQVKQQLDGRKIDALGLNAGLQFTGRPGLTAAGLDVSFVTNHLGHFLLYHVLRDDLAPDAIVTATCSGTHHPDEWLANLFGFRGAFFPSAARVATGDLTDDQTGDAQTDDAQTDDAQTDDAQAGMDLYATSKLCNIYFIRDMAKRLGVTGDGDEGIRFIGLDPGLMAGTGLARDRGRAEQWAWRNVLPLLRYPLSPFGVRMSTPVQSGAMLAQILSGATTFQSGDYVDFKGRPAEISDLALDDDNAAALYDYCADLVGV
ncbi:MAG: SDR family NAD(P)-dependent oxidoreductase [Alphaproteobacteria bacterium]